MTLRILLLGPPRVVVGARPLVVDTRKAIAMLAYLALVARPIARESLVELLWPEADPDDGRGALRRTLSTLRSGLGGAWLQADRRQVALAREDVDLDVMAFRAGVASGDHATIAAAVAAFRGEFLEGFALRDSPAFDEWQSLEGEALRGELAAGLRQLIVLDEAAGRMSDAVAAARRLVALDNLDEAAHRTLIRLLATSGDRAAATRQYRELVRLLDAELGIAPAAESVELHQSVVDADAPPARPADGRRPALDRTTRAVLAALAVVGEPADPDLVVAVAESAEGEAIASLERLVEAGVLGEPVTGEPAGYHVVDAGALDEALAGVGLARRRALHRRAAEALRERFGDRAAGAIAEHLARAGRDRDAADAHVRAAEAARRIAAHDDAAGHLRAALALGHPDRPGLLAAIGEVETLRGRYGEALAAYEQGAALVGPAGTTQFELRLGSLHLRRGALELADLHLAAALARLGRAPSAARARALADRSLVALRRGRPGDARRHARASLRDATAVRDPAAEAQALNLQAMLARRDDDLVAARRLLRRSLERAGLAEQPGARVAALNNLALVERAGGNLQAALDLTEEALRRCALLGDRHREAALRNNRADLLHALGRHAEAEQELVRSATGFAGVGERDGLDPEIWKLVEW